MRTLAAGCLLFALLAATAPAQAQALPPGTPIPPPQLETFVDGVVRQAMERDHIAGIAVGIVQGGETVLLKGYGFADIGRGRRVDPAGTLFRIGSITKTFTWILLMKAVTEGRLRLDDPINTHLPPDLQIPDEGFDPIRVRHLFTHSAGFEDLVLGHLFERDPAEIRPFSQYMREERPRRVWNPGEVTSYSNYGAGLAGAILEHLHQRPWQELVEGEILGPLNMESTTTREPYPPRDDLPAPLAAPLAGRLSTGYRWNGISHVERDYEFLTFGAPAGVMSSTAADMTRYMQMLLNGGALDGVQLFGPEVAAAIRTPMTSFPPAVGNWNAGFWDLPMPGGFRNIGHDGGTLSFFSTMVLVPELGLGIFVATNTDGGGRLTGELPSQLVERFYGPPPAAPPARAQTDIESLVPYTGTYVATRRAHHGLEGFLMRALRTISVTVTPDGYLVIPVGGVRRFVAAGEGDLFVAVDAPIAVIFRREDGRVRRIDTVAMAFDRVGPLYQPSLLIALATIVLLISAGTLVGAGLGWRHRLRTAGAQRVAGALQFIAAALWIAAAIAMAAFSAALGDDIAEAVYRWPTTPLIAFSTLALAAAIVSAATLVCVPFVWRQSAFPGWTLTRKMRFTAAAVITTALGVVLALWGALAPWSA